MGVAEQPTGDVVALAPGVGVLMLSLPHAERPRTVAKTKARENTTT
jgi:hypothetical protein